MRRLRLLDITVLIGLLLAAPLASLLASQPASAQELDATAHFRNQLGTKRLGSLALSRVEPRYRWLLALLYSYASAPLQSRDVGVLGSRLLVAEQHLAEAQLTVGLPRLTLGLAMPVVITQRGEAWTGSDGTHHAEPRVVAAGDLRLHTKLSLLDARRFDFGLSVLASLTTPTGQPERFAGSPGVVLDSRLALDAWLGHTATFVLNIGYVLRSKAQVVEALRLDDALLLGLGFRIAFETFGLPFSLWAEILGDTAAAHPFASRQTSHLEGRFGLRFWSTTHLFFDISWGVGILRGAGQPSYRALAVLGVAFDTPTPSRTRPAPRDTDGDTIPDASDRCPRAAEDFDRFEDADGCPEPGRPTAPRADVARYRHGKPVPWWRRWRWKHRRHRPARGPAPPRLPGDPAAPPDRREPRDPPAPHSRPFTPSRSGAPRASEAHFPNLSASTRRIRRHLRHLRRITARYRRSVTRIKRALRKTEKGIDAALPRASPQRRASPTPRRRASPTPRRRASPRRRVRTH